MNELLTYAVMLDSLTTVYVHFMLMLTELKSGQDLKCLFVQQDYHSPNGMNHYKNYDVCVCVLHF